MSALDRRRKTGMINAELWSELSPEQWFDKEYAAALSSGVPVIASVGYTPEEVAELGKKAEKCGVQALEVTVHYTKHEPWEVMKALREAVSIPIIAKLSPHNPETIVETARSLEPYVDAIAAINSLGPVLRIDIETGKRIMGTELGYGWLSGSPIKPLALRVVFDIARSVDVPVIGIGGIKSGPDVVEFLMAGASAVEICTQNIFEGPKMFTRIEKELRKWLDDHNYKSVNEIVGLYIRNIEAEKVNTVEGVGTRGRVHLSGPPPVVYPELCVACPICEEVCEYDAIAVDKNLNPPVAVLNTEQCFVCGLCVTVCPTYAISISLDERLGPVGTIWV
jgi:dihydroorotate dehydrogenase subfamily 1